jgi:hypothetical protein
MIAYGAGATFVVAVVLGCGLVIDLSLWAVIPLIAAVIGVAMALLARRRHRGRPGTLGSAAVHYGFAGVATLVLIQLVPYGRTIPNPPVLGEPSWADDRTRQTMVAACFACHSNEVSVVWYSRIAPLSWAVADHIDGGREAVNYSTFTIDPGAAAKTIETILDGSMPPRYFTYFGRHPEARFTDEQIAELVAGLAATPGLGPRNDGEDRSSE